MARYLIGCFVGLVLSCTSRPREDHCSDWARLHEDVVEPEPPVAAVRDAGAAASEQPTAPPYDDGGESTEFAGDVTVAVHRRVRTLLEVHWEQLRAADEVWLEFEFDSGTVRTSPPRSAALGAHREVVLGVPEQTEVTLRVVSGVDGLAFPSPSVVGTTGALPAQLPRPEVLTYDPERASRERYLFGSVEDSDGGEYDGYYLRTFWLYILDRQGRIVWYYADPSTNATSSFQRIALDGEYIWIEKRPFSSGGERSVLELTLDWEYLQETDVPGLSDCIDVTAEGSLLYDVGGELREMNRGGEHRSIWSCTEHFGAAFHCYTNTINHYPEEDTVLLSFPYENTVVEVDRHSGELVGQYGNPRGSYRFGEPLHSPPQDWVFSFQHFPTRTEQGTLLVSTHLPGCHRESEAGQYQHGFVEFDIDREARRLEERWRYTGGPEWPHAKGMALRLENGNTLVNYGTGGVIREVTPGGRTVFHVEFDVPEGNDFYNKMVGHNVLVDDLYALNGGPR